MSEELCKYRPVPYIIKEKEGYKFISDDNNSLDKLKVFISICFDGKALCYILSNGKEGILQVSKDAVLNANYVLANLKDDYHVP